MPWSSSSSAAAEIRRGNQRSRLTSTGLIASGAHTVAFRYFLPDTSRGGDGSAGGQSHFTARGEAGCVRLE